MGVKCILCGELIDYDNMESHVINDHMISYSKYYEYYKTTNECKCRCGNNTNRLTPWLEIYNPCLSCSDKRIYYESVLLNIDKFHNLMYNNKFMRLFILNEKLRDKLIGFNLLGYCNSLEKLCNNINPLNLVSISTKPGKSPYIREDMSNVMISPSQYNIKKKEIIMCEDYYKFHINGVEYELKLPIECEYHNNNHYRYNILNRNSASQSAKKLLLSSGTCIKFHNTNLDKCKSILKISRDGKDIYSSSLSQFELDYIKFYIMSNPTLLRYIFNVLYEIIKNSDTIYDYAFILNKVVVNPNGKFNMVIDWTVNNRMMESGKDQLNISIL